jgi:hypothetical protein
MGYWCTLHLFDDKKFYKQLVPALKGEDSDLANYCFEFLKSHIVGGINKLSLQEVNKIVMQTIHNIISISNSLDKDFKINSDYEKIENYDSRMQFLGNTEGYYDFCKFFEYMVFNTCADFNPHLPLGKGGVSRNFEIGINTFACSVMAELDYWNEFLCGDLMGITNWITHEDVEILYLDKENLHFTDNKIAEGFMSLLEVAYYNQLGFIAGVDMREERLKLLPGNKLVKPETWTNEKSIGLLRTR